MNGALLEQLSVEIANIPSKEIRERLAANLESIAYFLEPATLSLDEFMLLDPQLRSPLAFKLASLLIAEGMTLTAFLSLSLLRQTEVLENIDAIC